MRVCSGHEYSLEKCKYPHASLSRGPFDYRPRWIRFSRAIMALRLRRLRREACVSPSPSYSKQCELVAYGDFLPQEYVPSPRILVYYLYCVLCTVCTGLSDGVLGPWYHKKLTLVLEKEKETTQRRN